MRRISSVLVIAGMAACGSDAHFVDAYVSWMDWPSEVVRTSEFTVHLVVSWPCGARAFNPGSMIDESAVTYAPHFVTEAGVVCALTEVSVASDVAGSLDTADVVSGLSADFPRTYEMRAASSVYANSVALDAAPVRTFGEITVRTTLPPPSTPTPPRNAAGFASAYRDPTAGCMLIKPTGLYKPGAAMALENPPDTSSSWYGFVRGEIQPVAACGAFRTFHLVSRN